MNWLECSVIEQIPGKVSGAPLIKGSRVRPDDILNNLDLSEREIAEAFGLRQADVHEVLTFYRQHGGELITYSYGADTPGPELSGTPG